MPREKIKHRKISLESQLEIGSYVSLKSRKEASEKYKHVTMNQIKYYQKKFERGVHWDKHGGRREETVKITNEILIQIMILIGLFCDFAPSTKLYEYQLMIFDVFGVRVNILIFTLDKYFLDK